MLEALHLALSRLAKPVAKPPRVTRRGLKLRVLQAQLLIECRQLGTIDVARNDDSAVPVEDVLELAPVVHQELLPHADGRISWGVWPGAAAAALGGGSPWLEPCRGAEELDGQLPLRKRAAAKLATE